jgi:SAM-dependent methyltransferase
MMTPPGLRNLRARASRWLRRYGLGGDPAPSAATWDAEYAAGRWAYLGELPELARFSVLAGYLRHFKPGGAVLDVGCGEGVLLKRLRPEDNRRYVGVDLSSAAIEKAIQLGAPNTAWSAADAQLYTPTETFDAIVFNEVLYFFDDPPRTVERYARALNPGGVFLLSINSAFQGGLAILDDLKRHYVALDETHVTHGRNTWSWVCAVLAAPR